MLGVPRQFANEAQEGKCEDTGVFLFRFTSFQILSPTKVLQTLI